MKHLLNKLIVSSILVFSLILCSTNTLAEEIQTEDSSLIEQIITSPETLAVCKAADVISTIYIIESGIGVEANPIIAWTMKVGSSLGIGAYTPLIAISVLMYKLAKENQERKLEIAIASAITCAVATSNIALIP